jgi:Holliday junction resolvase-like predicted endonuclease
MQNTGEEIAGAYLKSCLGCDFLEFNFQTPDVQGEIDVVGINIKKRVLYVCEVATHPATGLMYVNPKTKQPDNVERLMKKFTKDIAYAKKYFADYQHVFMFWSPVVRESSPTAKHNQMADLADITSRVSNETGIDIRLVVNEEYQRCLTALREHAARETKELKSPVLRLMQIEEKLSKHLNRRSKRRPAGA